MNSSTATSNPETSDIAMPLQSPWLYCAMGLAQGAAFWGLQRAVANHVWPATSGPLLLALGYLAFALPVAWYLSQSGFKSEKSRVIFAGSIGVLFALLGAHAGDSWKGGAISASLPGHVFAAVVLGFVLVPLAAGFNPANMRFNYPRLFELAWRNAVLIPVGGILTGMLWMLLWAAALLMQSIGLRWLRDLLLEPAFFFIATGGAFGLAFGLALAKANTLLSLRRFWLSLTTWFLPLALAFAVVWTLALPFTGLQPLFATRNAAFYLLWFGALTITFANAAFQDGHEPPAFPQPFATVLSWAWLVLPVIALIADWALWQRIAQHGLTPSRIWAAVIALLVTVHTVGYACSVFARGTWMKAMPATNVAVALLEVAVILILISPVGDVRKLAVNHQVARLQAGAITADKFDWKFLRFQSGPYGIEALNALAAAKGMDATSRQLAQRASEELKSDIYRGVPTAQDTAAAMTSLRQRVVVRPAGVTPEPALLEWLARPQADWNERMCGSQPEHCNLWLVDLDNDGRHEAVLLWEQTNHVQATLYAKEPDGWRKQGSLRGNVGKLTEWQQAIDSGQLERTPPKWPDLMLGGKKLTFDR